jgi:hypothetical protein
MLHFKPESTRTDVGQAVEFLTRVMKRRCTAFLLSDFFVRDSFEDALTICNRKHDVVAIQIYDRRAKELPNVGLMKVYDAETGHEMVIDTSSRRLRQAHTAYWLRRQSELRQVFSKCRVDHVSIATHEDYVKMLLMLFKMRA